MSDISNVTVLKLDDNKELKQLRLTPTGKISNAKTRVYAQRYRKDWEQHPDFQGWLTSVPNCPTRAYCLYCKRDLHAHRLSLLKHTCTMKHQRAALAKNGNINAQAVNTIDIKYVDTDNDQEKEYYTNVEYLDGEFHQVERLDMDSIVMGYESRTDESLEEVEDESAVVDTVENERDVKKTDTLIEAMRHIQSDDEEQQESIVMVDCTAEQIAEEEMQQDDEPNENDSTHHLILDNEMFNTLQKEVIILRQEEDPLKKTIRKVVIKPETILSSNRTITVQTIKTEPSAKIALNSMKKEDVSNESAAILKETITKRSRITTHVIDTNKGNPISGLQVSLYKLVDGRWTFINESSTTNSGFCNDLLENLKTNFSTGRYKLHFDTEKYYTSRRIETLFPFVEIVFDIKSNNTMCHMPLLLSPYSYTIHRGFNNDNS